MQLSLELFAVMLASMNTSPPRWQQEKRSLIRNLLHTADGSRRLLTMGQTTLIFTAPLAPIKVTQKQRKTRGITEGRLVLACLCLCYFIRETVNL